MRNLYDEDGFSEPYSSSTFPELRPFQATAINKLYEGALVGRHQSQLLMAPTGSGKTLIALRIIHDSLLKGMRCLFVCDRITLIDQTSRVADSYGLIDHGVIQADHWRKRQSKFQIASVQTLAARRWPDTDVIVIDECHTRHKSWTDHIQNCTSVVIGLSATPFSKGLGLLFSNLVNAATMHELVESGILAPMTVFSCIKIDMAGAKVVAGEWTDKAVEERGSAILGDVVSEYQKHTPGEKALVFGATIAHAEAMVRQFEESGIRAEAFTSRTTTEEREEILREFRKPDSVIRVLASVEALSKGFDVPDVTVICDCRPLRKSLSAAIQMWGRGMRSYPGKTHVTLLDFSGNIVRFVKDYEQIYYEGLDALDDGEILDQKIRKDIDEKEKKCPKCGAIPFGRRCISCGYVHVPQTLVSHLPGEMVEFRIGDHTVARKGLWEHCVNYCRTWGNAGTVPGRAAHLYKSIAKTWPPSRRIDARDVPLAPVPKAVENQAKANLIAWKNRKV